MGLRLIGSLRADPHLIVFFMLTWSRRAKRHGPGDDDYRVDVWGSRCPAFTSLRSTLDVAGLLFGALSRPLRGYHRNHIRTTLPEKW